MPLKKKCVSCIKKPKTQNNSFVAPNINSQKSTPKPKPKSSPKLVHKPKPKQKTIVPSIIEQKNVEDPWLNNLSNKYFSNANSPKTPKPKPKSNANSPKTPKPIYLFETPKPKPKPKSKSKSTPLPKPSPNSNSENSNSEYLSLEQIQEKISKLKKKLKNFPKPNNGIPTNNMVRVMAELTILTMNALEKLEQKRKTMTSRINKLKGKKVVRRLNFNK